MHEFSFTFTLVYNQYNACCQEWGYSGFIYALLRKPNCGLVSQGWASIRWWKINGRKFQKQLEVFIKHIYIWNCRTINYKKRQFTTTKHQNLLFTWHTKQTHCSWRLIHQLRNVPKHKNKGTAQLRWMGHDLWLQKNYHGTAGVATTLHCLPRLSSRCHRHLMQEWLRWHVHSFLSTVVYRPEYYVNCSQ